MPNGPPSLKQAMIPHQTMMNHALPPHVPSPSSADADATLTGTDRRKIRCLVVDFALSGGLVPASQRGKMLKSIT